nr:integrase, catalytic region, zinc finger, CCHC-type, peptidase aspartic, catalytic [Tanacetum cinerariifolium]
MFDDYFKPPPNVDHLVPEGPTPVHVASTSSPSSTTVDQDAPSTSTSQTTSEQQSLIIPQGVEDDFYDIEVAHMDNDPYFGILIPEPSFEETTLQGIIPSNLHHLNQSFDTLTKLTKKHPLENFIGDPSRPVSTRSQLQEHAIQYGRMILESVQNGPLIWPTIEENGVTRPRKYSELTPAKDIQADFDVKATNIILQSLSPEIYALERECKLYDEFNKFAYKKGEILRDFYFGFSLLLNDMNIYNVKLEQFQVNTKFLNTLPPEWSKFVIDFKLDLHTSSKWKQFWEDPRIAEGQATQTVITHNAAYQADVLDACDSDCDELNTAKVALMANFVQAMPSFKQSSVVNRSETEITSDRNIIPYSQDNYVSNQSALNFDQYFELNELKAQSQEKDTVITKFKERIQSLSGNVNKDKSIEISDLNANLQEKGLIIAALKDELRKLKGKALVNNVVTPHTIAPKILKIDVEPIAPRLLNNRTVQSDYLRHAQEQGLKPSTSASESQPSGNTKKDKIQQPPSSTQKNKIEAHHRTVKSSLKNKNCVVEPKGTYLDSGCSKHMTGDRSQLTNFVSKFFDIVKFKNDHVAKIMGYGDDQIGNVMISRVYYVEGLGHNLFFVGQSCDSNLKVAFRQHTCFIRNLEGKDLLTGSRGNNLYTLSIRDMMASSPICLLSKASKTKSWLWHRRLSHLNFGAINHLARHDLVRGLPKLKFEKDHLCSALFNGQKQEETPQT